MGSIQHQEQQSGGREGEEIQQEWSGGGEYGEYTASGAAVRRERGRRDMYIQQEWSKGGEASREERKGDKDREKRENSRGGEGEGRGREGGGFRTFRHVKNAQASVCTL